MLILLSEGVIVSKDALALALCVSIKSVHQWRKRNISGDIDMLLEEKNGGRKVGKITTDVYLKQEARLNNAYMC